MAGKEPNPQGYLDFWGNTPTDPTTAQGKTFAPVSSGNSIANPRPAELKGGANRIINQIEQAADYYGPMFYQLLGYNSMLELTSDPNVDFIPISQTKANPKLFVVGLIPPSNTITGRALDRSASIGGAPTQELDFSGPPSQAPGGTISGNSPGAIVTASGYSIDQGTGSATNLPPVPGEQLVIDGKAHYTTYTTPQLWGAFTQAYTELYGRQPTNTEVQFYTAQALLETNGGSVPNNNFGGLGSSKIQSGDAFQANTSKGTRYFNSYPDATSGAKAFISRVVGPNPNVSTSAANGDVLGYSTSLAQTGYYEEPTNDYYRAMKGRLGDVARGMSKSGLQLDNGKGLPRAAPNCCAFKEDGATYQRRVGFRTRNRFTTNSPYDANCPLVAQAPQEQDNSNSDWHGDGSLNASASRKEEDKTKDKVDLNRTELGQRYQKAQAAEIMMTAQALDQIKNTPPLRLLVNPTSFKINSEKIISDGNFTRQGPIIEHWGEQQDKLDISGKIAAFFAIDSQPSPNIENLGGGPGLTRVARQYSASYQNFLSLYLLYRNNGGLYVNTTTDIATRNSNLLSRLSLVGSVYIYYDNVLYIGSFDSFSITETDTAPYTLEYSAQFTVRATFALDGPTEYDFNVKSMFQINRPIPIVTNQQLVSNTGGGDVNPPPGLTMEQAAEQNRQNTFFQNLARGQGSNGNLTIDPSVTSALNGATTT